VCVCACVVAVIIISQMSSKLKSQEMLIGTLFICLLATIMCSLIAIKNYDLYFKYQDMKIQADRFTLMIQCYIEQILTREYTNPYQNPTWTFLKSKFLISIIHPMNNTRKTFEESSVPISLYYSVVRRLIFFSNIK